MGCEDHEVSILIVDDGEITRLNRQYFGRHRPTNVISFPMGGGAETGIQPRLLGDVVISAPTAARHARAVREPVMEEVLFLLVHGILHLVGYDHEGPVEQRKEMEAKEKEIFLLLVRSRKKG